MFDELVVAFMRVFDALDVSCAQDPQVTVAAVAALFDRVANPTESDQDEPPSEDDIDRAASALHLLIALEACHVKRMIRGDDNQPDSRRLANE